MYPGINTHARTHSLSHTLFSYCSLPIFPFRSLLSTFYPYSIANLLFFNILLIRISSNLVGDMAEAQTFYSEALKIRKVLYGDFNLKVLFWYLSNTILISYWHYTHSKIIQNPFRTTIDLLISWWNRTIRELLVIFTPYRFDINCSL